MNTEVHARRVDLTAEAIRLTSELQLDLLRHQQEGTRPNLDSAMLGASIGGRIFELAQLVESPESVPASMAEPGAPSSVPMARRHPSDD